MIPNDHEPPVLPGESPREAVTPRDLAERRLAMLRTISPLAAIEQDWVDSDFVAARIWTE
jgi:hypothetical protein